MTLMTEMTEAPHQGRRNRQLEHNNDRTAINPLSLPLADAARLLTRVGGQAASVEMIRADLDAGAPTNADGSINLIHYAAWLVREMNGAD